MSTTEVAPSPVRPVAAERYRFSDSVRSEWTKFRSVRSTYWTFLVAIGLCLGLTLLVCNFRAGRYHTDPEVRFDWNPVDVSLRVVHFLGQLPFCVLGIVTVTSEYSTGMIRTSLAAVPRRTRMMLAKILVFAISALVVGEALAFTTFASAQAVIEGKAPSASLGQHLVLRVVIGAGLYLVVIGVLGSALAIITRHAAAGISMVVAIIFILPGIASQLPTSWAQPIEEFWPTQAGQQVVALHHGGHTLSAWVGFGEFAAFTAAVLMIALLVLERRDA